MNFIVIIENSYKSYAGVLYFVRSEIARGCAKRNIARSNSNHFNLFLYVLKDALFFSHLRHSDPSDLVLEV